MSAVVLTSWPATLSMLLRPSSTTCITWVSLQFSRLKYHRQTGQTEPGRDLLAEGWNDSLSDEVGHLGFVPTDGEVGDCPGRLFLSLKLSFGEVGDDHRHEPGLYDCLDLLLVARRDV